MTDEMKDAAFWQGRFLDAIKALHEALDVIDCIDSECVLPPQLQDMVDVVLAPRRAGTDAGLAKHGAPTHE